MNTPWIVGALLAIAFFVVFERYAFNHPGKQNTLSMAIFQLGAHWPLSIFIMGMFIGALAVHFFWHWCPPGSISVG